MNKPSKDQLRAIAAEIAASVAVEIVMIRLTRRIRYGPRYPRRGPMRRLAAAVTAEVVRQAATELYRQRLRMRIAVDRAVAAQSVAEGAGAEEVTIVATRTLPLPKQRQPRQPGLRSVPAQRSATELSHGPEAIVE